MQIALKGCSAAPLLQRRVVAVASHGRPGVLLRSRLVARAQQENTSVTETVEEGVNLGGEYCSLDKSGKRVRDRTIGEMEQEFLEALGSYYYEGKPSMTDQEFELLKEELLWSGSKVAILDSDELKFLEASKAYQAGKPVMSDEEFEALKAELKAKNSVAVAQGPRCSLRSRKMYSDASIDYVKMTALNIPATLLLLGALFSIDDITGFEITEIIELPPPIGILALWGLLLPALFLLATSITNLVLRDGIILRGPCPNCGTDNGTYFGDIFTVPGNKGNNKLECSSCKADLSYDQNKRVIVVDKTPEEKQTEIAAAAAKKAAAAAKKAAAAAKKAAKTEA